MHTNLPLDTYLSSTARWSALTDHRRYSNDDVQPLVPAFHPLIALPLRPGFSPEPEIETETAQQRNQRINQQLEVIITNQAVETPGRKAWKTRRANQAEVKAAAVAFLRSQARKR